MEKEKIGLLGGSFDPIHFGHIHLALCIQEAFRLHKVLFCPTFVSPFKIEKQRASAKQRKEMVELGIGGIQQFEVLNYEVEKEEMSYTIDTINFLLNQYERQNKRVELHLILGEDLITNFARWKNFEGILKLAPPLIGSREGSCHFEKNPNYLEELQKGIIKIPLLDISSTMIRERIKTKLYCGHLVPSKVLDYIHQNQLYY